MKKVQRYFRYYASVVLTVLSFIIPLSIFSAFILSVSESKAQVAIAIGLCSLSFLFLNTYVFWMTKKKGFGNTSPLALILAVTNNILFVATLIPLFVYGKKVSASGVEAVVTNIYIFYYASAALLAVGWGVTLFLTRSRIKKSNWWVFITCIPFLVASWILRSDYKGFNAFVHAHNFSYQNVANMLRDMDANMLLLNPTWYKFLSITIVILVLMTGLIAVEFTWKKTSIWRKKVEG